MPDSAFTNDTWDDDDPLDDWPCGALLVGACDYPEPGIATAHWCEHPDNTHDDPHQCACGHTWTEAEND